MHWHFIEVHLWKSNWVLFYDNTKRQLIKLHYVTCVNKRLIKKFCILQRSLSKGLVSLYKPRRTDTTRMSRSVQQLFLLTIILSVILGFIYSSPMSLQVSLIHCLIVAEVVMFSEQREIRHERSIVILNKLLRENQVARWCSPIRVSPRRSISYKDNFHFAKNAEIGTYSVQMVYKIWPVYKFTYRNSNCILKSLSFSKKTQ